MHGIAFLGDCNVELMTFPDPVPGIGEVVLEMKASGICGTDLMLYRRPSDPNAASVIGGHEPCGIVAELGPGLDATRVKIGDRVMVHHYFGCTTCEHCRSGWAQLCQSVPIAVYGNNRNGGHASHLVVPAATLIALPDELSFETGAAISCGSGTAFAALRRLNVSGADTIAIFGQGPIEVNVLMDLVFRQITVFGSWTFSASGQIDCARFVVEHGIDVDAIFTHRWDLADASEAYRITDAQDAGKGVFLL